MQDCVRPEQFERIDRRSGNGHCRIASDRLQKDAGELRIHLQGLFGNQKAVVRMGDDDRVGICLPIADAPQGDLEQAVH